MRILVEDVDLLPAKIGLSNFLGEGTKEYLMEYIGLFMQYHRCRI
jgi:hypothetical protein